MCIWEVQTILYSDRISLIVLLQTWSVYIHSGVQEGGTLMIFIWSNTGDRTWPTETYGWGLFEIQSSLFPIPFFSTQLISLDYRFWWLRSNLVYVFTSINKSILRWCSTAMEEVVYWVWRNCSLLVVMQRFLLCCILQHLYSTRNNEIGLNSSVWSEKKNRLYTCVCMVTVAGTCNICPALDSIMSYRNWMQASVELHGLRQYQGFSESYNQVAANMEYLNCTGLSITCMAKELPVDYV